MYQLYAVAIDHEDGNHKEQFFGVFETIERAQAAITPISPMLKLEPHKPNDANGLWQDVYRAYGNPDGDYDIWEWWAYPITVNEFCVDLEDYRKGS